MKWWPFFNFFIMAAADILFAFTLGKLDTSKLLGGLVIWNFSVWSILMKWWLFFNFFIVANANIPFPLTLTTFGGWSFGIFSVQWILMKWQTFLDFFHNCWCYYSISFNTQKTGDLNFGGVSNLEFFCTIDINEIMAIFNFFIMANANIPFPLTLGKLETQTLGSL